MRPITNPTRKPHWDAHGRLIRPGGIIGFEHVDSAGSKGSEAAKDPADDRRAKPATESNSGKGSK